MALRHRDIGLNIVSGGLFSENNPSTCYDYFFKHVLTSISIFKFGEKEKKLTTPKREAIIQRAQELFHYDNLRHGCESFITPTESELKESGYFSQAVSELMMDEATHATEPFNDYIQAVENFNKKFTFDIETALTQGTTICGGRGCGKSTLAKQIVKQLQEHSVKIKVFDNSQAWQNSSIETIIEVTPNAQVACFDSAVYDLSRLIPTEHRKYIEQQVKADYYSAVNMPQAQRESTVFVFEECEIVLGRSVSAIMQQLISVGRNYRLSYLAIAQRLQRINTDLISLSNQLFIGRMHEQNDLRKISNWLSNTEQLKSLELGDFIKYSNGKTELAHVQPFEDTTEHTFITAAPLETVTAPQPRNVDYAPLAKVALICALGVILLIGAVA